MSQVITIRLPDALAARLKRLARRYGYSQGETGARLIDEGLRRTDFGFIDFRDSSVGRQAYIQGSGLAVWEVVILAHERGNDVSRTAEYLGWPAARVQAALNYADAYPDEIDAALDENAAYDATAVLRMLPQTRIIEFDVV